MFYAIRHGATLWNEQGRFQGRTDVPLSGTGRAQAQADGGRLAALFATRADLARPVAIRFSPLSRAAETARILAGALGLAGPAVVADPRLAEAGFGAWEGLTTHEVKARFPDQRRSRKAGRWSFAPPGGESYADLERAMRTLPAELAAAGPALLVTHSGNLRVLMALAGAVPRAEAQSAPVRHGQLFLFRAGTVTDL